jgi:hypothetical protein
MRVFACALHPHTQLMSSILMMEPAGSCNQSSISYVGNVTKIFIAEILYLYFAFINYFCLQLTSRDIQCFVFIFYFFILSPLSNQLLAVGF